MDIYENTEVLDFEESDGAVTKYLSLFETMIPSFKNVATYKYIWKNGDRIDRVSYALLGSTEHWKAIMLVNPKYMDPTDIVAGDIIKIPHLKEAD